MQVERAEERSSHPLHVRRVGVVAAFGRLVRATEPDEVGRNATQSGGRQHRDHFAVQEAPRRLAVHQEHDLAVARTSHLPHLMALALANALRLAKYGA